jgi:hypothetical protein
MATEAQIDANRRNARKSTGPRTAEGKERSRRNALRHGLAAEHIAIFDEDPDDYASFDAGMRAALSPIGEDEDALADRIILGNWRLRRVWRAEAAAINAEALSIARRRAREAMQRQLVKELEADPPPPEKDLLGREQPVNLRSFAWDVVSRLSDAEVETAMAPAEDAPPQPESPDTPVWPEQKMLALARYEASIERNIHRSMQALERLQAMRVLAAENPVEGREEMTRQIRRRDQLLRKKLFAKRSQFRDPPRAPQPAPTPLHPTPPPL